MSMSKRRWREPDHGSFLGPGLRYHPPGKPGSKAHNTIDPPGGCSAPTNLPATSCSKFRLVWEVSLPFSTNHRGLHPLIWICGNGDLVNSFSLVVVNGGRYNPQPTKCISFHLACVFGNLYSIGAHAQLCPQMRPPGKIS